MFKSKIAPEIGEFCVSCNEFCPHDNGSVRVLRPLGKIKPNDPPDLKDPPPVWDWKTTTKCQKCGWLTVY